MWERLGLRPEQLRRWPAKKFKEYMLIISLEIRHENAEIKRANRRNRA